MAVQYHPLFQRNRALWMRYRLAYEGGSEYIELALSKHAKEADEHFNTRKERAIYPNHLRAIVDTYAAHLYRETIARVSSSTMLQGVWQDMDLMGTPADEFWEHVAQLVQRDGRAAVVVDRWDGGEAETRAQEVELGRRPYAYAVEAEQLVDWSVDRHGRLLWVVIREDAPDEREPLGSGGEAQERYRIWTRTAWKLVSVQRAEKDDEEDRVVTIDEGEHPVGEVPVTMVFWGKRQGAELVADSALKDLEPMGRRLTRLVSLIDEQIYQHVFSIMAVPESTWEALEKVKFSPSGAIPFADGASKTPHYISPDVAQIAAIRAEIDTTERKIRQLSGLGRVSEEKNVNTGIALSYLTMDKDALLAKFGQRMSRAESSVDRHMLAWMEETAESTRTYPAHFDPLDLTNDLGAALKLISMNIEGEALAEVQRAALRSYLGAKLDPTRLQEVLDGITATSTTSDPGL